MERPWSRPSTFPRTPAVQSGLIEIGAWVRASRRNAQLTQRTLEVMSGVDQTTISRLENGRLSAMRLVRLAAVVGALRDPRLRRDPWE
ncbi:MAG: helix-turn-helix domain-containing protein [Chloroflexota bacterium]